MREKRITRVTLGTAGRGKTEWGQVGALTDEDIEAAVRDDPDAAPILSEEEAKEWFKTARVVMPPGKEPISIRVDRDVLEWFRASGEPYQTRINAVLRAYMEHERSRSGR